MAMKLTYWLQNTMDASLRGPFESKGEAMRTSLIIYKATKQMHCLLTVEVPR